MPGGCFPAVEGANVSISGGGANSKKRWSLFHDEPLMGHQPVDFSNELTLRKSAILTYGVVNSTQSSCRVPALSPQSSAARTQFLNFPAGITGADAADPVAAHVTENSATESGASSNRRRAVLSSPGTAASTQTASSANAGDAAVLLARAPAAGLNSTHSAANVAVSNNVASSSLLSVQQAGSIPGNLPAGYQTYREMITALQNLAALQCPELEIRERRNGPSKVDVVTLKRHKSSSSGASSTGSSRSEKPTQQQQRVFILTGEHPRELLPPAVLLRFVQLLCGVQPPTIKDGAGPGDIPLPSSFPSAAAYGQQQEEGGGEGEKQFEAEEARHRKVGDTGNDSSRSNRRSSSSDEEATGQGLDRFPRLLDNAEFEIILNANPSGREKVEEGDYCRRGTINNVDLNRNWGAFWESTTQENSDSWAEGGAGPGEEERAAAEFLTGGPAPFSEPETQLLRELLLEFHPTLFISLHSGSLGVYTPFGYADYKPRMHGKRLQQVASSIAQSPQCRNVDSPSRCVTGTAGKYFAAKGNCIDWVYTAIEPTPLPFLLEIYQGLNAASALPGQVATQSLQVETVMASGAGATGAESETPSQQQSFAFAQPEDAEGDAANNLEHLSGVHISKNESPAKEASLAQQVRGTQYQKEIKPHFFGASFRERVTSLQQPSSRVRRPYHLAQNVLSSLTRSSNRGHTESDTRSLDGDGVKMAFLETGDGAASAAAEGAMVDQLSSGEYTPQDCFRAFNPHTEHSREMALNNWADLLRQLIEEAGAPVDGAE